MDTPRSHGSLKEDADVAVRPALENQPELERNFGFLACLGLAFAMLNSWTAMSASLSLVLPSGGSVAMVWGLVVSAIGTMLMCISLAEICHVLPMSGGQYDWSYILAPQGLKNSVAFYTGWMACAGWIALVATAPALGANFITGLISLWHPEYEAKPWHTFVIHLAYTMGGWFLNVFAIRLLPLCDLMAGGWSLSGIVIVIVTLLSCAHGDYRPADEVFVRWTNTTGWPDGMAFILGLLQSVFGLTGFEGASHMIEEMPKPSRNAPKVMVTAVLLGFGTSWIFMIVLLFCLKDWQVVIESTTGPLLQIYYQATNSRVGATCLLVFNVCAFAFTCQGLTTVASRMVLAFARDRGIGKISPYLCPIHPQLKVPVWSVTFTSAFAVIFGLIGLGSTVATNAILSSSVVMIQISYLVPILFLLFRGANAFHPYNADQHWSLGKARRILNLLAAIFLIVTSVVFLFPPEIPVLSGSSMNYVVVVLGIVWLMCGITWVVDGRKRYFGPSELEERLMLGKSM